MIKPHVFPLVGTVAAAAAAILLGTSSPADALSCGAECNQVRRECMDASSGGAAGRREVCDERRSTCREQCAAAEAADRGCGNDCAKAAAGCFDDGDTAAEDEACANTFSTCLDACVTGETPTTTEAPTTTTTVAEPTTTLPEVTTTLPACECPEEE
ncbi:MAG TPA: hypothetical protein VEL28_05780 [Candidatus Binatia bacterium]|nr:hypothetical protein [Candidatus Binatia bacterium]